jgi:hypothetical protein
MQRQCQPHSYNLLAKLVFLEGFKFTLCKVKDLNYFVKFSIIIQDAVATEVVMGGIVRSWESPGSCVDCSS